MLGQMKKRGNLFAGTVLYVFFALIGYGNTALAAAPVLVGHHEPELGSLQLTAYKLSSCNIAVPCSRLDYVELYNKSSSALSLDGWQLNVRYYDPALQEIAEVVMPIKQLIIRAKSNIVLGDVNVTFVTQPDERIDLGMIPTNSVQWITVSYPGQYETVLQRDVIEQNVQFTLNASADGYTRRPTPKALVSGGMYTYPADTPLRIRELFSNTTTCTPLQSSTCFEYVKVCNMSDEPISLLDYRLATSATNVKYTRLKDTLGGLTCQAVTLDLVASGGAVWLEDSEGYVQYPDTIVQYPNMSASQYRGYSWAEDNTDDSWGWGQPMPQSMANMRVDEPTAAPVIATRKPCLDGQYRSEETGRCRSLALQGDTLQPCKDGQYRSEETNRCRSLTALVSSALKPCGDDQFRNPSTGRCKKIASVDDLPKPCADGYERNAETNRCRKIKATKIPAAAYPVQPNTAASSPGAWIALGIVIAALVGYGIWEWRTELMRLAKRLIRRK